MKRFTALAALVLLALTTMVVQVHSRTTRWADADIPIVSNNTSTVNGITPRDSVVWTRNSAAAFGTSTDYSDTTVWFSPHRWDPALDINGWRTGVLNAGDTTLYMQLIIEQVPGSSITASIDSVFLAVQGSWNGSTPTSSAIVTLLDATATENVQRVFFTQLSANNPSAVTLSTMGSFPFVRFILSGDYGGKLRLRARYLTKDD